MLSSSLFLKCSGCAPLVVGSSFPNQGLNLGSCSKSSWSQPLHQQGVHYGQFSSVAQSCLTLCDHMDCSTPGSLSITNSQSLLKLMSIESVMPSNHLILCLPLLLLPSIFPSIRVFSSESVLRIRQPKYWSFGFNISPSNEYSGLISFKIDWFDLLTVPRVFSNTTVQKYQFFSFLYRKYS